jgi:catalase
VLLAAAPPAPDARSSRDSKAGAHGSGVDPRVVLLVSEALRHAKAIGAWGAGVAALPPLGAGPGTPGIVTGKDPAEVVARIGELLAAHRVWDRN